MGRTEWLRGAGGAPGVAPAVVASLALASCCLGLVVSPIYQMMTVAVCTFRPEALPDLARLQIHYLSAPALPLISGCHTVLRLLSTRRNLAI